VDEQVKIAVHSLVDMALLAEKMLQVGSFPRSAEPHLQVLEEMIKITKKAYTKEGK
jgi:porphobilinogen deaminase